MDPRERYHDPQEGLRAVQDSMQSRLHTAFPGIIRSWNPKANTVEVDPAIRYKQLRGQEWVDVELNFSLLDCPVHFPAGGGVTLTFPIKPGDECIVIIAERCIDAWWERGGIQSQAEFRMHDLSDGFVIPKVWSVPNVLPAISTNSAQLRTTDGTAFVEVMEDGNINVTTTKNVTITAGQNVTVNAGNDVTVNAGRNAAVNAEQDILLAAKRDVQIIAGRDYGVSVGRDWNIDGAGGVNLTSDGPVNIKSNSAANITAPQINEGAS